MQVTWKHVREALARMQSQGRARGLYIAEPCCEIPRRLCCNNGIVMAWKPRKALAFVQSCIN